MIQINPRPKDDLTETKNVRNNKNLKTFEIILTIAMFIKSKLAYIEVNCDQCKIRLMKM